MKVREILTVCYPESIRDIDGNELWSAQSQEDISANILDRQVYHIQPIPGEWPTLRIIVK